MEEIGIRQARVFLAVADCRNVTRAARAINRSQTSVTKSLHDLEDQVGEKLFDRTPRGVTLNAFGSCLLQRVRQVAAAFDSAGQLVPPAMLQRSTSMARFFAMDVSDRWLDAFLAVVEHQKIASAAEQLGLTSAAVSASLRKLEDALSLSLFERTPTATVPTLFSKELARYVKLARNHLRTARDEISGLRGIKQGRLVVGTLPFVRTRIVPLAITRLLDHHSYLDISTIEGPYDDLVTGLRCGDIDIVIGALRGDAVDKDLQEEMIFADSLSVIVRAGHPLATSGFKAWKDLLQYQWILPCKRTPTRKLFEQAIQSRGLSLPEHIIETSSTIMLRGLLIESDRVTVLSRHQIQFEEEAGLLTALPFALRETERPIGMTRRSIGDLSPAAGLFVNEVRAAVADHIGHRAQPHRLHAIGDRMPN